MALCISIATMFGFILIRHVNSAHTNGYWNHNVQCLQTLYPGTPIVIIDDHSDPSFLKADKDYVNVQVVQSEFRGRGELLPFYYLLKHKFFSNAVIVHDSVFFRKRVHFEKLKGVQVLPLWHFHADKENVYNTLRIARHLVHPHAIMRKLTMEQTSMMMLSHDKWCGCFGVQCYISLPFLEQLERKYGLTRLVQAVASRPDRCCLERIMGCLFFTECPSLLRQKSLLGNIMTYDKWGYTFAEYLDDQKRRAIRTPVVKVWTGR